MLIKFKNYNRAENSFQQSLQDKVLSGPTDSKGDNGCPAILQDKVFSRPVVSKGMSAKSESTFSSGTVAPLEELFSVINRSSKKGMKITTYYYFF